MHKKYKVLKDLGIKKAGSIVELEIGKDGLPVNTFWRKRLLDSKKDGCLEEIKKERKIMESESKKSKGDK